LDNKKKKNESKKVETRRGFCLQHFANILLVMYCIKRPEPTMEFKNMFRNRKEVNGSLLEKEKKSRGGE